MNDKKEKILKACKTIPNQNLTNFIKEGIVTLSELIAVGLQNDKVEFIKKSLKADDDAAWSTACITGTAEAYSKYLTKYPDGQHCHDAKAKLEEQENYLWERIQIDLTREELENYLSLFPNGMYIGECRNLLEDLPWLETKRKNTISDYESYKSMYPGKHISEVEVAINVLNDDNDWHNACIIGETYAYKHYLEQHPSGKHSDEARNRIQSSAGRDRLLSDLRANPNSHNAKDIQEKVKNNVATWDDIASVFDEEKKDAIKNYKEPSKLPESTPPQELSSGSTEVYFWGTPASGKTCALGSIISSAKNKGIFEALSCSGHHYMDRLSNIFGANGICTFPESTSINTIQEMIMNLRDEHNRNHKVTLIDLAGELFRAVYTQENDKSRLTDEQKNILNIAMPYLKDTRNNKIHFFVVEYGAHDRPFEGDLKMGNYLDNMVAYLKKEKIFTKTTVGVYIIVTKCDMIDCAPEDRPQKAYLYVENKLHSFLNTLQKTCDDSGVGDFQVISYSIGDVFAQNLCKFDAKDTDKVLEKLLTKTPATGSKWDWLLK